MTGATGRPAPDPDAVARCAAAVAARPGARWLVTGPVNSGKSLFLEALAAALRAANPPVAVGGVICRGVFAGGAKAGYTAVDCMTGAQAEFARLAVRGAVVDGRPDGSDGSDESDESDSSDLSDGGGGGDVPVGRWVIAGRGLDAARTAIGDAVAAGCACVFVDEFGRMECGGAGLRASLDAALASPASVVVAVRADLAGACAAVTGGDILYDTARPTSPQK